MIRKKKSSKNDKLAALLGVILSMSHLFFQAAHGSTVTKGIQLPANEPISPLLPVIQCLLPLKTAETSSY